MKKYERAYKEFLMKYNLKSTNQRRLIFDSFIKLKKHVSAENFCAIIKQHDKSVGQATVYRMLKLLTDSGIAQKLEMGNGVPVYEPDMGHDHHDHMICEICGNCIEFHDEGLEKLQLELAEKHDFYLTTHKMVLYGICRQCRENVKNQELMLK